MRSIKFTAVVFICLTTHSFAASDLQTVKLAEVPAWARDTLYSGIYLDIDRVMTTESVTRLEAVEIQNTLRDTLETSNTPAQTAYEQAVARVKSGQLESGWKPVTFQAPGDFVAALDMDETLLMQWYGRGNLGFFDFKVLPDTVGNLVSGPFVKLTPKAEEFIRGLAKNPSCKGIVIFSAKADAPALDTVRKWTFSNGEPMAKFLSGVFTRNHLIFGKKALVPSKDLRILDPMLEHVVIVDDNPARIFQPQTLKAQPKFDADEYGKALEEKNTTVSTYYENILPLALSEIEESAKAATELNIPFTQAFLPYSYSGERAFRALLTTTRSRAEALKSTRLNPHFQEAGFVPAPPR